MSADEAKINQLALQIEKLTKRDLEIQAQVEAEATETSSRQIELDRTAEEFRVLHAERQKLVQQWKETIEVAARRDQDITKTATEYVQQKQAKEVVDVDLKAAREDLDKVQALHTELQTEVTARERQLQARREFLLSEQERKKKLEEEIDIIKTELVRSRRPVVFSLLCRDSSPSDEVVGRFFFEFELFRTASGPSRRVRETAVASMASSRDSAFMKPSS